MSYLDAREDLQRCTGICHPAATIPITAQDSLASLLMNNGWDNITAPFCQTALPRIEPTMDICKGTQTGTINALLTTTARHSLETSTVTMATLKNLSSHIGPQFDHITKRQNPL